MLQCVSPGASRQSSSPYELLIKRIFRQINSSAAQSRRQTIIVRQPEESADDWDSFLEQLDVEESVRVTRIEHGTARLKWTNQHPS
ncbi:DUF1654 domain-containing protein [Pseudomonas sp. 21LCFQ010]|uniref:DUF1654 domain-containing protein n=1 Tax=Pseudomonas sp. 21LCFQ010 TaxID=2957506 RepID=UPI002097C0FA|nr:DUF1654 domain-containing protein [Pseudomonas sp. 21LCFQ010]MCO8162014.1 DUF1654 domain-containing protein [Pseudomonas sp. 21LCFQ010]